VWGLSTKNTREPRALRRAGRGFRSTAKPQISIAESCLLGASRAACGNRTLDVRITRAPLECSKRSTSTDARPQGNQSTPRAGRPVSVMPGVMPEPWSERLRWGHGNIPLACRLPAQRRVRRSSLAMAAASRSVNPEDRPRHVIVPDAVRTTDRTRCAFCAPRHRVEPSSKTREPGLRRMWRGLLPCHSRFDVLPGLNAGDSCRAAHAAPRWVPASLPSASASAGLTSAPQASRPARPAVDPGGLVVAARAIPILAGATDRTANPALNGGACTARISVTRRFDVGLPVAPGAAVSRGQSRSVAVGRGQGPSRWTMRGAALGPSHQARIRCACRAEPPGRATRTSDARSPRSR
jgi:hypothetical protein